jgi:hypothetical protein
MPQQEKHSRRSQSSRVPEGTGASHSQILERLAEAFNEDVIDELREQTGYNPRKRVATAFRLMLVCVEACLSGKTLGFASIRAFFVKRFGSIRPRAFQLRFKSEKAVAFFRAALDRLVADVTSEFAPALTGALADFDDVHVYDGSGQRAPVRGRKNRLKATTPESAGSKWVVGYSLRSGIAMEAIAGEGTTAEIPMWKTLVPHLRRNVLYLLDLGFYCRYVYEEAIRTGSHVLMRLKADEENLRKKLRVVTAIENGRTAKLRCSYTVSSYLRRAERFQHREIDLRVDWGFGPDRLNLRVVGLRRNQKWFLYLTTVSREQMSVQTVTETYRLRWLIEFLFREWKQETDWGRSATADRNALEALTYASLIAHVLVRSMRIAAAYRHQISLDALRPLACMHVARAFSAELVTALLASDEKQWRSFAEQMLSAILELAHEPKASRSRQRIASNLGALGG